ncbi:MAG: DUF427 domain-containing protein [Acidimicrobiales bacterium]
MTDSRPHLEPGPDHPITVEPYEGRVTVRAGSAIVARTTRALELREADYPPVLYVPVDDVDGDLLRAGDQHTYCPYKGEASYYDLVVDGDAGLEGAVWHYPEPYPAVAAIRGHVAFYADRVAVTAEP